MPFYGSPPESAETVELESGSTGAPAAPFESSFADDVHMQVLEAPLVEEPAAIQEFHSVVEQGTTLELSAVSTPEPRDPLWAVDPWNSPAGTVGQPARQPTRRR